MLEGSVLRNISFSHSAKICEICGRLSFECFTQSCKGSKGTKERQITNVKTLKYENVKMIETLV
jgi:hypothetical protein